MHSTMFRQQYNPTVLLNVSGTKWYVDDGPHLEKKYYIFLEQARWVKTVNISQRIAKSMWDKTVGSERAALAVMTSGSLSTGSPVGSLE
jgi:hypothetical protein